MREGGKRNFLSDCDQNNIYVESASLRGRNVINGEKKLKAHIELLFFSRTSSKKQVQYTLLFSKNASSVWACSILSWKASENGEDSH